MKRRVQAQRKFAQGVTIPATPSQNIPETNQPVPSTYARGSNVHCKLSCNRLLDVVAYGNLHTHRIPIVVLERLKTTLQQPNKQNAATSKNSSCKIIPTQKKAKNVAKVHKKRVKTRAELAAPTRLTRLASKKQTDTTEDEDERPLKYLKVASEKSVGMLKKGGVPSRPVTNTKPCTRSRSSSNIQNQDDSSKIMGNRQNHQSKDAIRNPELDVLVQNIVKELIDNPASNCNTHNQNNLVKVERTQNHQPKESVRSPEMDVLVKNLVKDLIENPAASPSNSFEPMKEETVSIASPSIIDEDAKSAVFYSDRGIEQWMEGQSASKEWQAANRIEAASSILNLPSGNSVNSCQGKGCQQCSHCQVANKCKTLQERLPSNVPYSQRESQGASTDVYNFDAECDNAPPQGSYQPRKQRPPPPPSIASTTYGDNNKLYFDILPPNVPQIIELTAVKIANSKERKLKARMISRSECPANPKKMSLVEHEIMLDELLKMIPAQPQAPTENFKVPNRPETRSASKNKGVGKKTSTTDNSTLAPNEPGPLMDEAKSYTQLDKKAASPKTADAASELYSLPTPTQPPPPTQSTKVVDAPTYYPTEKEFNDPIAYFEKITPEASKFGICKVVAPKNFDPECVLDESINFDVSNQYIARLFIRWGPCAREMAAIKACLSTQGVKFKRPPLMAGVELDLPKLYKEVQKRGGLNAVNKKKVWNDVAEAVGGLNIPNPERKLDSIYVKYLVPYETLSHQERQQIKSSVETAWINRNKKLLDWAFNPLQRQKKLLGEAESSESEAEEDDVVVEALAEAEDCVARGRKMTLGVFKNVALSAQKAFIKDKTALQALEADYWRLVLLGERHVCVNAASIDTGDHGYGFSKGKTPCAKHPWNLKKLSANPGNVLRSLGAVLGVTVPTLHLGMVYSTSCWHRDPHGLPWVEYMHQGSPKIWYGIPNEQSRNFRKAVEVLCPTSYQNKSIWLPSDITMIPPNLLNERNVSLSRVVQNPGEYIIVFPKAYSCSISTGFTVSESVYFATNSWLNTVHNVFQELRESCEPTTFSLEQLLISIAMDMRAPLSVLPLTHAGLATLVTDELRNRRELITMNIPIVYETHNNSQDDVWNVREEAECEYCRATLYLSMVTGISEHSSAVCLTHALQMLQKKCGEKDVTKLELVLFFFDQQLEEILTNLQNRLT